MRAVLLFCALCFAALTLGACAKRLDEFTDIPNGAYKLVIRDSEFGANYTHYIDLCVADAASTKFPGDRQCFLTGVDFSTFSAKWAF